MDGKYNPYSTYAKMSDMYTLYERVYKRNMFAGEADNEVVMAEEVAVNENKTEENMEVNTEDETATAEKNETEDKAGDSDGSERTLEKEDGYDTDDTDDTDDTYEVDLADLVDVSEAKPAATATIDVLNDDCLEHIIKMLPMQDRVRLEGVNRRWRAISRNSWRDCTRIQIPENEWCCTVTRSLESPFSIYHRCGQYVKEVAFKYRCCEDDNRCYAFARYVNTDLAQLGVYATCLYCPRVESILHVPIYNVSDLAKIAQTYTKLRRFVVSKISPGIERNLGALFERNPELEEVGFDNGQNIRGSCLGYLTDAIQVLSIKHGNSFDPDELAHLRKFTQLRRLTLNRLRFENRGGFELPLAPECRLESLELRTYSCFKQVRLNLDNLANLTRLVLQNVSLISDDFLLRLTSHCRQLSHIELRCDDGLTDRGMAAILELPLLEELEISELDRVTDRPFLERNQLGPYPKLRRFVAIGNYRFSCAGFYHVFSNAPLLRYIEFSIESDEVASVYRLIDPDRPRLVGKLSHELMSDAATF